MARNEEGLVVSLSRIKSFRQCTMAHHYQYDLRLRPRQKKPYIEIGSVVHELLEAHAKGLDWRVKLAEIEEEKGHLFQEEIDYYGDIIGISKRIMLRYLARWKDDPLEYVLVEPKDLPLVTLVKAKDSPTGQPIKIVIRPDALVKWQGDYWLYEIKTSQNFPSPEFRIFDVQTSIYSWGLERLGYPKAVGVLWEEIRTKDPTKPQVLASGQVSRRKNIDTDWWTYRRTLKKHGLDPKNYRDMRVHLQADEDKFFRRIPITIRPNVRKSLIEGCRQTAIEIAQNRPPVLEFGFHCRNCFYNRICQTKIMGNDVEFVIKKEFKVGSEKEEQAGEGGAQ